MKHKIINIEIGEKLKKARISCGYTQEEVCELLECAPRYISQLETNQTVGSIPTILYLCSLYKISLNDLYADYLNFDNTQINAVTINGYLNLNEEYRGIIDNNISYLNNLQKNK